MHKCSATSGVCLLLLIENLSSFLVANGQSPTGMELREIHQFRELNIGSDHLYKKIQNCKDKNHKLKYF